MQVAHNGHTRVQSLQKVRNLWGHLRLSLPSFFAYNKRTILIEEPTKFNENYLDVSSNAMCNGVIRQ